MSLRVDGGGGYHHSTIGTDQVQEGRTPGYSQPPSTGPDILTFLWQAVQGAIGQGPSLQNEKEHFEPRWKSAGFIEKLEMVLRFKEEVNLHDCQTTAAVDFFFPYLEESVFDPIFAELGIDNVTLLAAVHDPSQPHAKTYLGKYRDHLDTYLTHVMGEVKKTVQRTDISSHRKAFEFLKIIQTEPKPEDGSLTRAEVFRACYAALPEADKGIWREAYRAKGGRGSDEMLDYGITHASQMFVMEDLIFPLIISRRALDPHGKAKDCALMSALIEAQGRGQKADAKRICEVIGWLRGDLFDQIVRAETEDFPALPIPKEGSYLSQDPLSEVAKQATKKVLANLSS